MANRDTENFLYGTSYHRQTLAGATGKKVVTYGLDFPTGYKGNKGYFNKISGVELVKKNIRQLLLTEKGQRVMLPDYGISLKKYLFSNMDEHLFSEIKREIMLTLAKYSKDTVLRKLSVFQDDERSGTGGHGLHIVLMLGYKDADALFEVKVGIV